MIDQVRPAELAAWFAQTAADGLPLLLDVREPWEREQASVPAQDFELVVIPMGQLAERIAELDPTRPTACLCHHGEPSQHVAANLAQRGHLQVVNITGGIDAWAREHDPGIPRY
ncbi:MAG: rhodanese-like domain-containing protein [Giesbergeria sp.]|nr:rhodanese-like domain-containing protein [Giesbergeria sp.]